MSDELTVSTEELTKLGQEMEANSEPDISDINAETAAANSQALEDALAEAGNWADDDAPATDEAGEPEVETDVPQAAGTIKFKANGQEQEISLEEAERRLSDYDGSRKWTSDKAKAVRELKQAREQLAEMQKYQESWNKLEEIKYDKAKLHKLITGEDYETYMDREIAKREMLRSGSEADKQILMQNEKIEQLEREQKRREAEIDRRKQEAERREYDAEKMEMRTHIIDEIMNFALQEMRPEVANRLNKMIYQQSINDLQEMYQRYGKLTGKMYEKAVADNAAALQYFSKSGVEAGVDHAIKSKQETARQQAQLASTRNYSSGIDAADMRSNPLDLFNKVFKR